VKSIEKFFRSFKEKAFFLEENVIIVLEALFYDNIHGLEKLGISFSLMKTAITARASIILSPFQRRSL